MIPQARRPEPDTVRLPYWLGAAQRGEIGAAIRAALDGNPPCGGAGILRAVLVELAAAPVREQVWPTPAAGVRIAAGHGPGVVPIRLSPVEHRAVLALGGLSPVLLDGLGGRLPV